MHSPNRPVPAFAWAFAWAIAWAFASADITLWLADFCPLFSYRSIRHLDSGDDLTVAWLFSLKPTVASKAYALFTEFDQNERSEQNDQECNPDSNSSNRILLALYSLLRHVSWSCQCAHWTVYVSLWIFNKIHRLLFGVLSHCLPYVSITRLHVLRTQFDTSRCSKCSAKLANLKAVGRKSPFF